MKTNTQAQRKTTLKYLECAKHTVTSPIGRLEEFGILFSAGQSGENTGSVTFWSRSLRPFVFMVPIGKQIEKRDIVINEYTCPMLIRARWGQVGFGQ